MDSSIDTKIDALLMDMVYLIKGYDHDQDCTELDRDAVNRTKTEILEAFNKDERNHMRNWIAAKEGLMSGQGWFNSFMAGMKTARLMSANLEDEMLGRGPWVDYLQTIEAAKRAAGIDGGASLSTDQGQESP